MDLEPSLQPLYDAVLAQPDDDTPRLVLADALQERGDPRGAFITLQCQLATLRVDLESPDWNARKTAERELLASHRFTPAGLPHSMLRLEFRRGFVEHVQGEAETFLALQAELTQHGPLLRAITLTDYDLSPSLLQTFLATPLASRLTEFHFKAHDETTAILCHSDVGPRLHTLTLASKAVGPRAAEALARATALRHLRLEATQMGAAVGLLVTPVLESLLVVGDDLSSLDSQAMAERATALRQLELVDARLGDDGLAALAAAPLTRLESLRAENCKISAVGGAALGNAVTWTHCHSIDLRGNRLGKAGVTRLLGGSGLSALRELGLRDTALKDAGLQALLTSPRLATMERLNLRDNGLTDAAVGLLSAAHLPALKVLNVNQNALTRPAQEALRTAFPASAVYAATQARR